MWLPSSLSLLSNQQWAFWWADMSWGDSQHTSQHPFQLPHVFFHNLTHIWKVKTMVDICPSFDWCFNNTYCLNLSSLASSILMYSWSSVMISPSVIRSLWRSTFDVKIPSSFFCSAPLNLQIIKSTIGIFNILTVCRSTPWKYCLSLSFHCFFQQNQLSVKFQPLLVTALRVVQSEAACPVFPVFSYKKEEENLHIVIRFNSPPSGATGYQLPLPVAYPVHWVYSTHEMIYFVMIGVIGVNLPWNVLMAFKWKKAFSCGASFLMIPSPRESFSQLLFRWEFRAVSAHFMYAREN